MPISSEDAAAVAREHGLSLVDAHALQGLAQTVDEARVLARQFAPANVAESIRRKSEQLVDLFARTDPDGRIHPPTAEEGA